MPQKKKSNHLSSVDELLQIATAEYSQLVEDALKENHWDDIKLYSRMPLADFVEKRLMGVNENNFNIEHEINRIPFRLEHIEDSPRKKAAEVMLEKYKECYERSTDLSFRQRMLDHACNLLYTNTYVLDPESRKEVVALNAATREEYLRSTEAMTAYQNFMNSFFSDHAMTGNQAGVQRDPVEVATAQRILAEMAEALPKTPEYDIYRTQEGYTDQQAMAMTPKSATLVMNPNVITNITVDNFAESIRVPNPSTLNLEWGAVTFDNMMEGLYNRDEWKALGRDNKNLLESVYLDGKPALDVLPERRFMESEEDYTRRLKCEVVAYALEAKGHIDVTPFKKEGNTYGFRDPAPVKVKVNLEEKVSAWKRFVRFFHIKSEIKKEKAERISLEDLNNEDRLDEVRNRVRDLAQRENTRHMVAETVKSAEASYDQGNLDFFGFLMDDSKNPSTIGEAMRERVRVNIGPEQAESLGLPKETITGIIQTMERERSRTSMVRLYALSKGMSLDDILSTDPALKEQKEAIGREFVEKVSLKSPEEFAKENGDGASYKEYFEQKAQGAYDMYVNLQKTFLNQPFNYIKSSSPEDLMENYAKWSFLSDVSQDTFQCCPPVVKKIDPQPLNDMEIKTRSMGEVRQISRYCTKYLASESYVNPTYTLPNLDTNLLYGLSDQAITDRFIADTKGLKNIGEFSSVINEAWSFTNADFVDKLSRYANEPNALMNTKNYLENGTKPIYFFDREKGSYLVGDPSAIERVAKEHQAREAAREHGGPERETVSLKDLEGKKKEPVRTREPINLKAPQKTPMQKKGPQR